MASPETPVEALQQLSSLGAFFTVADATESPTAWSSTSLLYGPASDELDRILEETRSRLKNCEPRIAASIFHQGFAARLLSPQIALATRWIRLEFSTATIAWRRPTDQLFELGLTAVHDRSRPAGTRRTAADVPDRADLVRSILTDSFSDHLDPLGRAIHERVALPARVLAGNVASAVVGACRLLRPVIGHSWFSLAGTALGTQRLAGMGVLDPAKLSFTRRSCCLYYRVKGGGLCGDCPIQDRIVPDDPRTRQHDM